MIIYLYNTNIRNTILVKIREEILLTGVFTVRKSYQYIFILQYQATNKIPLRTCNLLFDYSINEQI